MSYPLLQTIQNPADLKALPLDRLPELAQEVRQAICDQVAKTGGHLAPNLGVVELTLALHYVFDFGPRKSVEGSTSGGGGDRLLFDVGHQCYPHKLITGRLPLLPHLRTSAGMAGFPDPRESDYDLFSVGHAGTGISTAVGMARGDDQIAGGEGRSDRKVVTLIGDSSIVNGVALEGINNAGTLKRQFLVVLNDNGMSIGHPQGAMAAYFDRVRVSHAYADLKKRGKDVIERIPGGSYLEELYHRGSEALKAMIASEHLFEHFGLICVGPIDGHDLPGLIDMLEELKHIDRPVLLHAKTIKGKGFAFSEGDATTFHSPKPFTVEGCRVEVKSGGRSFTAAYADAMIELMNEDQSIVAVTAAMPDGTGLAQVAKAHPDRVLDTGICESHAMDMCAGMVKSAKTYSRVARDAPPESAAPNGELPGPGVRPFFAVYSTFVQRALDQVFQEVSLQGHAVRLCLDRAGYVGGDGAVHHGFMDISMFSPLPGVVQLAAIDEPTLRAGLRFMQATDDATTVIRYPRDSVADRPLQDEDNGPPFELGKANLLIKSPVQNQQKLAILAYGVLAYQAAEALEDLHPQGYDIDLYDARFAMPVDIELIEELIHRGVSILTIEDHALAGGFGANVIEACNERRLPTTNIHRLAHPKKWVYQDSRSKQLAAAGLDALGIARACRSILSGHVPSVPEEFNEDQPQINADERG